MKIYQIIEYTMICAGIYLGLCLFEYLTFRYIIGVVTDSYYLQLFTGFVVLFFINPYITFIISERLPFKPVGLKLDDASLHNIDPGKYENKQQTLK